MTMLYVIAVVGWMGGWDFKQVFPDKPSCEAYASVYNGSRDGSFPAMCLPENVAIMNGYKPKKVKP